MKNVVILGSTGSIGANALKVIKLHRDKFRVTGLSTNKNISLLGEQIREFSPSVVCVSDIQKAKGHELNLRGKKTKLITGPDGLLELAALKNADIVVVAISTVSALGPLLAAIDARKRVALANKEAMVAAGGIITKRARLKGAVIIPVDSEHSAIFQCLNTAGRKYIKKIYLTATGGPLAETPISKMHLVRPHQATNHPKWVMGKKISVDSATMMNKGLEVIEAGWLFDIPPDKIEILIHPEAVVHSMVEFCDGVIIAQMGITDMRLAIQYALTYPDRLDSGLDELDFAGLKELHFARPDFEKFPCIGLAYEAARCGGTMPCVLNAANEELVKKYLIGEILLTDIARGVERIMRKHKVIPNPALSEILGTDAWARKQV